MPRRARVAAVTLVTASWEAEPSLGVRLLADLEEAPWGDIQGKPLDARGLAGRLKQYGNKPEVMRVGQVTVRGYRRAALEDQWSRDLQEPVAESVTSVTSVTAMTADPIAPPIAPAEDVMPRPGWRGDGRTSCEDDDMAYFAENPL